ncbi:MAG: hypothetical protein JXA95_05955 [Spirochaetales bacterium]|nr:hypothetical protein [Spirochaetales bacterium]
MSSLISSLLLIFTGLSAGYAIHRIRPADYRRIRQRIQTISLVFLSPFIIISTVWIAPWKHWEMFSLPFIGVAALMLGSVTALFLGKRMGMDREHRGVYFVCGGFSNLGSLGGLICYMLLGEAGYALVPFYGLFERFWYFLAGFPMAKSVSPTCAGEGKRLTVREILLDPFVSVTLASTFIGIILNLTVERPPVLGEINRILIPVSSFILMISIGLAMKFGPMKSYLKAGLVMGGIKGILLPLFGLTAGLLFGLGHVADGLPLKVVLIECAMPVGFTALVPPTMYDLDLNLANTCWFMTTMGLILVIPLLGVVLPLL